ncbi:hypothetical protein SmJEL517_g00565 [Synchytrium microbalum]|uniref:Uncharacterized protein n=1 Tax=Synchytrium microbalum TaxID=1806994 RepID=A0A507C7B9_9FUNG|nr:uncharacterized protein SmJEL517_g00565 [Synchytrium microbalum]TPX37470.1 hypothetical protein SmJEL517_g00565 [Synchytrium microbalum]
MVLSSEEEPEVRASTASQLPNLTKKKDRILLAPSNVISRLFFLWVFRLIAICRRTDDLRDVPLALRFTETAKVTGDLLGKAWELEEAESKQATLAGSLFRAFGVKYALLAIWKVLWAIFSWFAAFFLMRWIVEYSERVDAQELDNPAWIGYAISAGLFVSCAAASLCFHQLSIQTTRIGIQCRAALMVMIYRKSLRLSYIKGGVGDIVNLISNDCNRIAEAAVTWHYLWSAGFECAIIIALALSIIRVSAVPALLLILLILLPVQYFLAKRASAASYTTTALFTSRVHLISEILTAIKLVKFYAWESYYLEKVNNAKQAEAKKMREALRLRVATFMVVYIAPVVAELACLVTYYFVNGRVLSAAVVFTILSLFNTLRYPLLMLPNAVRSYTGAKTSLTRLEEYFKLPEVDKQNEPSPSPTDSNILIEVDDANFVWDGVDHPHITDLTMKLERGKLIGVIGDIASGRSLLAALMGQLKRTKGSISKFGTIGYLPQEPWLVMSTLKDNVLFGCPFEQSKYDQVIKLCGLARDFNYMSNGDSAMANEVNLTQNQRQRISLARCLYRDPDIMLIEDSLDDLDQATARTVFDDVIMGLLKRGKGIVLVTAQKQFLPDCDIVMVLKHGAVTDQGTFQDLKARHVNFSALVSDALVLEDDPLGLLDQVNEINLNAPIDPSNPFPEPDSANSNATNGHQPGDLTISDTTMSSPPSVAINVPSPGSNHHHATFATPNEKTVNVEANQSTIQALQSLNQRSIQAGGLTEQAIAKMVERTQLTVLGGVPFNRAPTNFANQNTVTRTVDANALTVHSIMGIEAVRTMSDGPGVMTRGRGFFGGALGLYVQETGLALGIVVVLAFFIVHGFRFVSDVWLSFFVQGAYGYNSATYLGVYAGLALAIALGVLLRGRLFTEAALARSVSLHRKILDAVLRAPMSYYDATPLGLILSNFARHLFLVDDYLPEACLQALSYTPILVGTIVLVCAVVPWFWATLPLYAGLAYLLLWYCGGVEGRLKGLEAFNKGPMFAHLSATLEGLFSIRVYRETDRFDSFNRSLIDADHRALFSLTLVKGLQALYIDLLSCLFIFIAALFTVIFQTNAAVTGLAISNALQLLLFVPWLARTVGDVKAAVGSVEVVIRTADSIPREGSAIHDIGSSGTPPEGWPSNGDIEFRNVVLRYHRYGVAVLKGVNVSIHGGETIAVVGRSGSGKTTLLVAMLRIVEASEGNVLVDNVNVSSIRLRELRSRIAVIPQEPVLLTGTVRSNLDPFGKRSDVDVWKALDSVHMGDKIRELPLKLDALITENGKMFTLAERQLFCIARAILLNTKIVVLDEPTSASDTDTDELIRKTLRDNFEDTTLIMLASHFLTAVQSDRILVMHNGQSVEFDTPMSLLDNPNSRFLKLVSEHKGQADLDRLRKAARAYQVRNHPATTFTSASQEQLAKTVGEGDIARVSKTTMMPRSLEQIFGASKLNGSSISTGSKASPGSTMSPLAAAASSMSNQLGGGEGDIGMATLKTGDNGNGFGNGFLAPESSDKETQPEMQTQPAAVNPVPNLGELPPSVSRTLSQGSTGKADLVGQTITFTLETSTSSSKWMALGVGPSMNGAAVYVAWKNSSGNGYVVSERHSASETIPTMTGVQDMTIVSFARTTPMAGSVFGVSFQRPMYNASFLAYGPVNASRTTNYIWGAGTTVTSPNSPGSSFNQHAGSSFGTFAVDFTATTSVSVSSGGSGPRIPVPPAPTASSNSSTYCVDSSVTFCVTAQSATLNGVAGAIYTVETKYTGYVAIGLGGTMMAGPTIYVLYPNSTSGYTLSQRVTSSSHNTPATMAIDGYVVTRPQAATGGAALSAAFFRPLAPGGSSYTLSTSATTSYIYGVSNAAVAMDSTTSSIAQHDTYGSFSGNLFQAGGSVSNGGTTTPVPATPGSSGQTAASFCVDSAKSFCLTTVPDAANGVVIFTIESSFNGWASFGLGTQMADAIMFVFWKNSTGGYTISQRTCGGHVMPTNAATVDANIVPFNLTTHTAGCTFGVSISVPMTTPAHRLKSRAVSIASSGSLSYVWGAASSGPSGSIDSSTSSFNVHDQRGVFTLDLSSLGNATAPSGSSPLWNTPDKALIFRIHGILMFVAWAVSPFAGIFIARFLKDVLGVWWYRLHVWLMFGVTGGITLVSVILVFLVVSPPHFKMEEPHQALGLFLALYCLLQIGLGFLSNALWTPDRPGIPIFPDKLHWWVGRTALLVGVIEIYLGLVLYGQSYPMSPAIIPLYWTWIAIMFGVLIFGQFKFGAVHHLKKTELATSQMSLVDHKEFSKPLGPRPPAFTKSDEILASNDTLDA